MVQQVGLLIFPPGISILVPFFSSEEMHKKVTFHPFYVSICRHTAALSQLPTTPRFDARVLMLQHGHTVLTGVLQHGTRLAAPHASTSRCGKSPKPVPEGVGLRLCWGDGAHLVLQGLLQVGSPATPTRAWPQGAARRCAGGFGFSKGLSHVWEPGNISRSHLKPHYHLKPVPPPVGCDGFPSETGFPVGQCPAACKLNCGKGGGKRALQPRGCSPSLI